MKKDKFALGDLVEVQGYTCTHGSGMGIVVGELLQPHPVDGELVLYRVLFNNELRAACYKTSMTLISENKEIK